jgi:hypothetical protein
MATLVENQFASESQHWYAKDGSPAYEVIGKNGKTRPATLRDARELGLVPSVTAILKLEAAPALTNWMIHQAAMACITLPRLAGEDDDQFIKRALEDSRAQAKKAAERGTYLHGLLEQCVRDIGKPIVHFPDENSEIIKPVLTWLHTNFNGYTWSPERSFACGAGYGGKIDLCGECADDSVTLDYKFKTDILPGKKLAYDNHATQLGAYANGLGRPRSRCINLFISSTVPGLIVPHEWSPAEIDTGYECFKHLLAIWKLRRGL